MTPPPDQPIEATVEQLEPAARLLAEACAHYEDAIDMMFDGPDESDEGYAKARWNDARAKVWEALSLRPAPETTASDDVVERADQFDLAEWIGSNLAQSRTWLETCEREVAGFEAMEHGEVFAERWRKDQAKALHRFRVAMALADLLADRDEWREQHENLLSVRQSDLANLPKPTEDFQTGVDRWMDACFGEAIKADKVERADRFCEEALELCQTMPGFTKDRAHALVDYVFDRPQGEISQEVGGVMVTLAALCNTTDVRIDEAAETELARVWTKVEQIRAKQASKPTGSALPVPKPTEQATSPAPDAVLREAVSKAEAMADAFERFNDAEHNRQDCPECWNEGNWTECPLCADRVGDLLNDHLLAINAFHDALASSKPAGEGDSAASLRALGEKGRAS